MARTNVTTGELFTTMYSQTGNSKSVAFICLADASGDFEMTTIEPKVEVINKWNCQSAYGYGYGWNQVPDYASVLADLTPTADYDIQIYDIDHVDLLRGGGTDIPTAGKFVYGSDSTNLPMEHVGKLWIKGANIGANNMFTIKLYYN